jgi:pyrimidine-specific ribonucleoside hydrolase
LLNSLHHEGILIDVNSYTKGLDENCQTATNFKWGDESSVNSSEFISIDSLANYLSVECKDKIDFINLGSLSTANYLISTNSKFARLISRIIWSSYAVFPLQGFNYRNDTTAVYSLSQNLIPLEIVQGEGEYTYKCIQLLQALLELPAQKICRSFSNDVVKSPFGCRMFDELTAVYFHNPDKFKTDSTGKFILCRMNESSKKGINNYIVSILKENSIYTNQIIKCLPLDTTFYKPDIRALMNEIISKHGVIEWNAAVTTFEIHRHIGTYALIGAKMGIRALEYFGAGVDELTVYSYAGKKPPVSCMNDGIQVSTGATLGHGLIEVAEDYSLPEAEFTYMNRTIKIKLKDEYSKQIAEEIRKLRSKYGLDNDKYWNMVRDNAINYWLSLNRHEIFEVIVITP